ncbi:SDR family NAD(P)-dependent oxidoreductase [Anaeromyxobacter terrae]|uniref:SDR family NAD(P)-dependent oxidoreductase n=1 Tax=Anaeromyxobacter terrae TaxID=2925406 RepID=UPI001F56878B|nr:SDR family NAD(P)-dependent oxidoreductase [Anaeromyxobacter sp. SG22]
MSEQTEDERTELTGEDLATALKVLARVAADRTVLADVDAETRTTLQKLAGEVARPDLKQRKKLQRALLRNERVERRARDEALRRGTGIQQLRAAPVFSTPLPELPPAGTDASGWWPRLPGAERAGPEGPAGPAAEDAARAGDGPELSEPRKCYVCKAPYHRLHPFYDQMCRACGDENLARRTATVDLRGRVALVTGARVKIGYQAAILLLRAGCGVVACTRFPRDAAARYAREPDFEAWKDRLTIHGVDLRHTPSVELLCQRLDATLPRLDFQLHNACQTVRRPPGFYAHLLEREEAPLSALPEAERTLLREHEALKAALADHRRAAGVTRPALLSQAPGEEGSLLSGKSALELFPRGVLDQDLQQVDLRAHNSWRLTLHEVPTLELLEVLLVNATAPFVMTARLKGLMLRARAAPPATATSGDPAKHVVLVSAMEGQFYREHKTDKHPHTNMAKAALNMIVRTSAGDYARDGIYLNAVDTGWVTDEDPAHLAARKVEEHAFSPPLDIVDGAARIVAPIFDGFRSGRHEAGLFFKDYRPTPW